jgi:hypothetical protein
MLSKESAMCVCAQTQLFFCTKRLLKSEVTIITKQEV